MQSHKRAPQRRFPVRELAFLLALVGAAAGVSWASGRTMVLHEAIAPLLSAVEGVTSAWNHGVERVQALRTLEDENARLKQAVGALEAQLAARDEQARESGRLHELLRLKAPPGVEPIAARVIGRNPDNWHHRLMLDVGEDRGVRTGGVAVTEKGLVGRVLSVSAHTAMVTLATDPQGSVSVLNTRTRSAGVMQGQGDSWPVLRYMEQPEKWKVGDRLVTSGLGGSFPKGLTVGRVVRLKNEKGAPGASVQAMLFPELRVATGEDLSTLEEVLVLPPGITAMPTPPPPPPKPKPSASPSAKPGAQPGAQPGAKPR